jgi:hypothetical protein
MKPFKPGTISWGSVWLLRALSTKSTQNPVQMYDLCSLLLSLIRFLF